MSDRPALPLVMSEPRGRAKPPRHLADLDEAGRKALLEEMGLPGFRARQLSTHYFGRLVDEFGELRFDPTRERRLLGAPPSDDRPRHVFRHDASASAIGLSFRSSR